MVRNSLLLSLSFALAACSGSGDTAQTNALDANLLGNAVGNEADPALMAALEDQIMVDPSLSAQANKDSIRPAGQPAQAQIPAEGTPRAPASEAVTTAAGGSLMRAPAPTAAAPSEEAATLGQLAARQSQQQGASCNDGLDYSMAWAARLPADMPLYPGARVDEAAGADGACRMRVVSFTTGAALQDVLDFYFTRARRSGFSAEHQLREGEHTLGGTRGRDDGAFVVMARARPGGGTEVDLVASTAG